jgi:hypothetical protein
VWDLHSRYENLPADEPTRPAGRVISLCAYTRLLVDAGERAQAQSALNRLGMAWAWWRRRRDRDR